MAHRFCKVEQVPHFQVPRSQGSGSLCQTEVAAEATIAWGEIWQASDVQRASEAKEAVARLREEVLASGEAARAAAAFTADAIRDAARTIPKTA